LVESALDDCCAGQQTLLERAKRLILNLDGSFLLKRLPVVEAALFEDGQQRVVNLSLRCVILLILLAHLHLVAGLSIDGLLKNPHEDVLRLLGAPLLVYRLVRLAS